MTVERYDIKLEGGTLLHMLWDGEGNAYGFVAMEAGGKARIWRQTWVDEYAPTDTVFPGFISAARAVVSGWV